MLFEQKIICIVISVIFLLLIIELVRRKKLREEYSLLWILTSIVILLLASFNPLLYFIADLFKAKAPTSVIYMLGIIFLLLINLHFSISISSLKTQVKRLAQKTALLELELTKVKNRHCKEDC